jgi:hypothetical protein
MPLQSCAPIEARHIHAPVALGTLTVALETAERRLEESGGDGMAHALVHGVRSELERIAEGVAS